MTYAEAANLAVNQTLVRSINTSIVALIPVGAILYVGVVQLGSGSLKDLALALFVGMAAGAYSSIFIATPLLVHLKAQRERASQAERPARQGPAPSRGRPLRLGAGVHARTCRSRTTRRARGPRGRRLVAPPPRPRRGGTADRPTDARRRRPAAAASYRRRTARSAGARSSGREQPTRQPRSKRGKK